MYVFMNECILTQVSIHHDNAALNMAKLPEVVHNHCLCRGGVQATYE